MKIKSLIRVPAFVSLMLAYTLNELAWSVGTLALSILVYQRTGSALGSTGFFLLSQVVPGFVAPLLVPRLEPLAPHRLLPVLYWVEAVLFAVLAWLTSRFDLVPVLVLVLVDGVVALTARSLAGAVRADILKPIGLLHEGNALSNTVFSVCFMVGPLIGGGVVALGGTVAALLVNCGLFAAMGVSLAVAPLPASAAHRGVAEGPTARRAGARQIRSAAAQLVVAAGHRGRVLHDLDTGRGRLCRAHAACGCRRIRRDRRRLGRGSGTRKPDLRTLGARRHPGPVDRRLTRDRRRAGRAGARSRPGDRAGRCRDGRSRQRRVVDGVHDRDAGPDPA